MTMKRTIACSAIMAAGLLFGSTVLSYADTKIYAASECVRWDENVDPATYINSSRRFNPSRERRLRLDCPAVKDRNTNIQASWIRVIDQNPNDEVCVRLIAFRQLGAAIVARAGAISCTGVAVNSPNAIHINTGALGAIPVDAHYYFSVFQIPPRAATGDSGVVTYAVNEVDFEF